KVTHRDRRNRSGIVRQSFAQTFAAQPGQAAERLRRTFRMPRAPVPSPIAICDGRMIMSGYEEKLLARANELDETSELASALTEIHAGPAAPGGYRRGGLSLS